MRFSSENNVKLLNIWDLQLDISSEDTLQASPMFVGDIEKELKALDEDLKLKLPPSEVEERNPP